MKYSDSFIVKNNILKLTKNQINPTFVLVITIFLQSFSLLSIKFSTLNAGPVSLVFLVVAFGFLGLRAMLWQYLLKLTDLSHVYPFAALAQILIFLYAVFLFNETITPNNVVGLGMMLGGIYIITR